jgi:Domain of unknown function DUF488
MPYAFLSQRETYAGTWPVKQKSQRGIASLHLNKQPVESVDNKRPAQGALFTIGYEGRSGAEVVAVLRKAKVSVLVDVRAVPMSRKPDFRRKAWTAILAKAGIEYYSCTALGTPRPLRDRLAEDRDYQAFFRDYRRHMRKQREPMYDLTALLQRRRIALMCFEADAMTCHRSAIADWLGGLCGLTAEHLVSPTGANVVGKSGR